MSASVVRGAGGLPALKRAVLAYIDGLKESLASHTIAVHTFDGQGGIDSTQLLMISGLDFSDDISAVKNAINQLQCDGIRRCVDPSSNLYGALVHINQNSILSDWANSGLAITDDGWRRQPYLVVFSDGTDSAHRATRLEARQAAVTGRGVISVGLQGEVPAASMARSARGVNVEVLESLSTNGVFVADTANLAAAFEGVGAAIATASASRYRLDYCSPKREGLRNLRLEFRPRVDGQDELKTYWQHRFEASYFDCRDGSCNLCLGGLRSDYLRKSCTMQPDAFEQAFTCENDAQPLNIGGYCRCPCAATSGAVTPYPSFEGPGPIKCEIPGTCFQDRPRSTGGICVGRGGLPEGTQPVIRFGKSTNSHVSLEFTPTCADGWPIPGLRMSACRLLSDFTVYETDASGPQVDDWVLVDPWESEPRVVCHPNIVSLILLDTSGSIRRSGLVLQQQLRDAVVRYLDYVNETAQKLDITHYVAIYAFDGRDTLQTIVSYGSTNDARAVMSAWACDEVLFCADDSTNLNGAVLDAEKYVRGEDLGLKWTTQRYMVLFTDGTDQAARVTQDEAVTALRQSEEFHGLTVYGIGLIGETETSERGIKGLDREALDALVGNPDRVHIASASTDLTAQFQIVAEKIEEKVLAAATSSYRVDYCSPKRFGMRRTKIVLDLEGYKSEWIGPDFNAGEFSCQSGACTQCLRHREFTCQFQPQQAPGDRDPQFFSCKDSHQDPQVVPDSNDAGLNRCKCFCPTNPGTYPPDPAPPPSVTPGGVPSGPGSMAAPVIMCQSGGGTASVCTSGATYTTPLTVTMSAPGAAIHYTTDGSSPSGLSPAYTVPIDWPTGVGRPVGQAVTLRAIAVASGFASPVAEKVLTTTAGATSGNVAAPTIMCKQGTLAAVPCVSDTTYQAPLLVSMQTATTGAQIFYTTDGSYPTPTTGTTYTAAANFVGAAGVRTTYRAVAVLDPFGAAKEVSPESQRSFGVSVGVNLLPTATVQLSTVDVPVVGTPFTRSGVLTGVNGGPAGAETAQVVTAGVCTATSPGIFSAGPFMAISAGSGTLSLTAAAAGTSSVTCTLTDNGQPAQAITKTFTVRVAGATPGAPSACPSSEGRTAGVMRLKLRMSRARFRKGAFAEALRKAISPSSGISLQPPYACVLSACPASACEPPLAPVMGQCPGTVAVKRARGCLVDATVLDRGAAALQAADEFIYVDFDIVTPTTDETAKDQERVAAVSRINADVTQCLNGQVCQMQDQSPNSHVTWVPASAVTMAPTTSGDDDDSSDLSTGALIAIIVGSVVACLLLVAIVACLLCGGKKKKKQEPPPAAAEADPNRKTWEPVNSDPSMGSPPPGHPGAQSPVQFAPQKDPAEMPPGAASRSVGFADPPARTASDQHASHPSRQGYHDAPPPMSSGQHPYQYGSPASAASMGGLPAGTKVQALYLDGRYYDATIWSREPDGTYSVQWFDGSHSDGIPTDQLIPQQQGPYGPQG